MLKKILVATAVLATSSVAFANGPYIGAGVGMLQTQFDSKANITTNNVVTGYNQVNLGAKDALLNVFGGYGETVNQNLYLGGEAFVNVNTSSSSEVKEVNNSATVSSLKAHSKYSYGVDVTPGIQVNPCTVVYARLGVERTRFAFEGNDATSRATENKNVWGGRIGAGVQTQVAKNLAVRTDYTYSAYKSINFNGGSVKPSSGQFTVSLLYNIG